MRYWRDHLFVGCLFAVLMVSLVVMWLLGVA